MSPDWSVANEVQTSSPTQPQPSKPPRHVAGFSRSQGRTQVRTPPRSANSVHTAPPSQIALARFPHPSRFADTARHTSPASSSAVQAPVRLEAVTQLAPSTSHTAKHAGPSRVSSEARATQAAPSSHGVLTQLFADFGRGSTSSCPTFSSELPSTGTGQPASHNKEITNEIRQPTPRKRIETSQRRTCISMTTIDASSDT